MKRSIACIASLLALAATSAFSATTVQNGKANAAGWRFRESEIDDKKAICPSGSDVDKSNRILGAQNGSDTGRCRKTSGHDTGNGDPANRATGQSVRAVVGLKKTK